MLRRTREYKNERLCAGIDQLMDCTRGDIEHVPLLYLDYRDVFSVFGSPGPDRSSAAEDDVNLISLVVVVRRHRFSGRDLGRVIRAGRAFQDGGYSNGNDGIVDRLAGQLM